MAKIDDQACRTTAPDGVHNRAPQLVRVAGVEHAVQPNDEDAVGAALHGDRRAAHRSTFRYLPVSRVARLRLRSATRRPCRKEFIQVTKRSHLSSPRPIPPEAPVRPGAVPATVS